jgi:hypothetical protein
MPLSASISAPASMQNSLLSLSCRGRVSEEAQGEGGNGGEAKGRQVSTWG